ncbi:Polyketide synthase, enoylreductase [Moorella glycerini]|uniref:Alcohol dehydrogenase n=1 Tax=Neomoorella stamsii TaxID=1266720 RepID=A0A9X7P700_9FIRM|nr:MULTISPECIES: zinc-binding dehydrogenase [Moorella]PRR75651.1 alcohol dehydrogenase [Moorella stamsii]CEP66507.1 Polyketide synthase, enoylreductase [Moorella glycerini]
MKAAIYEGPGPLVLKEVPDPVPGPEDVVLEVKTCGICHTDVAIVEGNYFPRHAPPLILGHEVAGKVVAVGSAVNNVKAGERVIVYQCLTCGQCARCMEGRQNLCAEIKTLGLDTDGAYAEYLKVPAWNLVRLPDTISFAEGSIITDALSTAYHAVTKLNLIKDEMVAIFGAGVLGLNAIQVASKIFGARVIAIDIEDWKLDMALSKGAWKVLRAEKERDIVTILRSLAGNIDAAMEFIGNPQTYQQAIASVRKGGRVVLVGAFVQPFALDPIRLFKDEVNITGSYASLPNEIPYLVDLVANNNLVVKDMVTHTCSLEGINSTIAMLAKRTEKSLRAIVEM